jgi:hypothetical protein
MKNIIKLICIVVLFLSVNSCGTFKVSTLSYDPIYTTANGETIDINVVDNEWELNRLLRDDFRFRYDYAQYAKSQPISFDWNNRILRNNRFNRYNFNNRYSWSNGFNMSSYWNRDMMWDDWLWGYSSMNYGMGWSYGWGNNSWSSNQWNSPYGWNNYYGWGNGYGWNNGWNNNGWNNGYRRGSNVAYNIGRRGSTMSVRDRIGQGAMIQSTKVKKRRTINTNVTPIPNNTKVREVRSSEVRVIKPIRNYNRIENNSNNNINRNNNNSRPIRTYSPPPRTTPTRTTPTRSSTPVVRTKGRGNN